MSNEIAVVYDYLHVVGGAELFSLELARRLPQARLVVAGVASDFPARLLPPDLMVLDARPLPAAPAQRALHAIWAFRRNCRLVRSFRQIILSGHYAPLCHSPDRPGLYYAHTTPLPFLYEDRARTLAGALPVRRLAQDLMGLWLVRQIRRRLRSEVTVLANSQYTAAAYAQRLGVQAQVLHPPYNLEKFQPRPSEGYFLSFARQEPGKRVERIIEAFRQCSAQRLVVASNGSENYRLHSLAAGCDNIEFVPTTDPQRIQSLLSKCRASIYLPRNEPFGISAVESLACGKPVIAARSGGLQEIIRHEDIGWLIGEDADVGSLIEAIEQATETRCAQMQADCLEAANGYDWDRFVQRITLHLADVESRSSREQGETTR